MVDLVVLDSTYSTNGWRSTREPSAKIAKSANWQESRIAKAQYPRRKYRVPYAQLDRTQRAALRDFYDLRNGPVYGFLLWDRDEAHLSNEQIGTGDGSTRTFQITRTITDAARTLVRPIYHPVPTGTTIPAELQGLYGATTTTTVVKVDGVTKTEGADYSVSQSTGIVTFTSAPASGKAITISVYYNVAVRFADNYELDVNLHTLYGATECDLIEVFE